MNNVHASNPVLKGDQRGFTLIELLVVLVIIGVMVSLTVISLGDGSRDREIRQLLGNLQTVFNETSLAAVYQQRQYGLVVSDQQLSLLTCSQENWQCQKAEEQPFSSITLPDGLVFRLLLDEREDYWQPPTMRKKEAEDDEKEDSRNSSSREKDKDRVTPHIVFLSSYEVTPFRLVIINEQQQTEREWMIATDGTAGFEVKTR
ncbi:type II secretion system minor pseudopilin GspH [Zooshikella ganghwensis]|uniref:type II secretion system minor pseudopilin GspH n=1 Tax=Zooshikella ganghwensis TaxID=202772 RepID=UPI00041C4058|nr:type II secretion system minor pseudopilin GspH [Zooshikella ganghwensis]